VTNPARDFTYSNRATSSLGLNTAGPSDWPYIEQLLHGTAEGLVTRIHSGIGFRYAHARGYVIAGHAATTLKTSEQIVEIFQEFAGGVLGLEMRLNYEVYDVSWPRLISWPGTDSNETSDRYPSIEIGAGREFEMGIRDARIVWSSGVDFATSSGTAGLADAVVSTTVDTIGYGRSHEYSISGDFIDDSATDDDEATGALTISYDDLEARAHPRIPADIDLAALAGRMTVATRSGPPVLLFEDETDE
jgi:hypothetical protein